jgi:hypothetical protein
MNARPGSRLYDEFTSLLFIGAVAALVLGFMFFVTAISMVSP